MEADAGAAGPSPAGPSSAGPSTEPLRVQIPRRPLLGVEHPCYVVNADNAVRMLGGTAAIAKEAEYLECSLRPDDPLSHPLFGTLVPTPGLLLKVTRRRKRRAVGKPAAPASTSASVVGTFEQSYRFEGLADFQYVSAPELCSALGTDAAGTASGPTAAPRSGLATLEQNALRMPPALFSQWDTPLEFLPPKRSYRTVVPGALADPASNQPKKRRVAPRESGAGAVAPVRRRRRPRSKQPVQMHYGTAVDSSSAAAVPAGPTEAIGATIELNDPLYQLMRAKFAQRPVWSRAALRSALLSSWEGEPFSEWELRWKLPQLSYRRRALFIRR